MNRKIYLLIVLVLAFCSFCGESSTGETGDPFVVECTVKLDGTPRENVQVDFQYTENTGSKVPGATWNSQKKYTDTDGFVVFEKTSFSKSVGASYRVRVLHPEKQFWSDYQSHGNILPGKKYVHTFLLTSD